ncbi:hypothetical protein CSUI_004247 [Cystoisospora suis]|uniref:SRS domain-containing protein n=1 Tax=Cystoisospora suis TaxID=483139 RepID=A0A2C6L299_9APIC|nr:hypothetical protein CSUI_004247 [Cystoisospora suis]
MRCRTTGLLAPLCLGAALTGATRNFRFPGIWVLADPGLSGKDPTACTAELPEVTLNAMLNDPLTFSCPSGSTLKPDGAMETAAPTACTEAACPTETLLFNLGIAATLSSAAGKRETGQLLKYTFQVTKLPSVNTILYYICQIPAPGSPTPSPAPPDPAHPGPSAQRLSRADEDGPAARKECRVKIAVPAQQAPASSTPAPPASFTSAASSSALYSSILVSSGALCLSLGTATTWVWA